MVVKNGKCRCIVLGDLFSVRGRIRGDISRNYDFWTVLDKVSDRIGGTFIVDSHPVYDGIVLDDSEQPRFRIAGLGSGGE